MGSHATKLYNALPEVPSILGKRRRSENSKQVTSQDNKSSPDSKAASDQKLEGLPTDEQLSAELHSDKEDPNLEALQPPAKRICLQ